MKSLSVQETALVSGGDYQLAVTMFVPTSAGSYVGNIFQQLVNGQMPDTAAFIAAMQDPAVQAAFDKVRVESVNFAEFN